MSWATTNMETINSNEIKGDKMKEVVYVPDGEINETLQLKPKDEQKKNDTWFLYLSVITANFLMFAEGCSMVWTSPVIPQLISNDSNINPLGEPITTIEISLLGGIPSLFTIIGTLLFGKLPDIIGRKNTLLCVSLGMFLSNLAMSFGTYIYVFFVGRAIVQLCCGLVLAVVPIYLNEVCEDHNRAKHGCLMVFFIPFGSLYAYLVGSATSVRWFTALCGLPLLPQMVSLALLVPESPFYTAARGDKATTIKTLRKLRRNKSDDEIEQDYLKIKTTLNAQSKAEARGLRDIFATKALRKGIFIGLGVCMCPHISGAPVVLAFLAPIFNNAGTELSGNSVGILAGVIKLLFFFITATFVGKFGRRPLLLFSSFGAAVPLTFLGVYFYLNENNVPIVDHIRWLPILCISLFICAYSLGLGSIPLTILSELFPNDLRSTATSFVMTIVSTVICSIITCFPLISKYLGIHYCLGLFSVCCFLDFAFIYLFLPETRGKSLLEIQNLLSK
ncbi:facilitated trehalose transporter Tret1-2 homolog isoform X1 [Leptinotarsa decemlineata]|uniref:facilitated trehalose transporter Tret1-2 homolog isoform X1 n=1 Tax=Leptinotarsa decemlineata TaxID=7539 RepID=UPI003D30D11A